MLNVTFGNYNYLGVLYHRCFMYRSKYYSSIKVALLSGVCSSKEELEELLLYRILQNRDFLLYLIGIDGKLRYINVLPIIFGELILSSTLLEDIYTDIRRRVCAAGAHIYMKKDGSLTIGISQIDSTYFCSSEEKHDAIRLNEMLCSNYRRHKNKNVVR